MHASRMLSRRGAASAKRLLSSIISFALISSFIPHAAVAADVRAIEVVAGAENAVVVCRAGEAVSFQVRLSADGTLDPDITQAAPARARVPSRFDVQPFPDPSWGQIVPVLTLNPWVSFWSDPADPSGHQATWAGWPTPYTQTASVFVPAGTPLGDYSGRIRIDTRNPLVTGATEVLTDFVADNIVVRVVAYDNAAPRSFASISGPAGSNGWYVGPCTLNLETYDEPGGSGVRRSEFSLDGGATWQPGTSVPVTAEGITSVLYRGVDNANNVEVAKTAQVRVDLTAPQVSVLGLSAGDRVDSAVLDFQSADTAGGSGLDTQDATLDGAIAANQQLVETPGSHTLVVTASDLAGNASAVSVPFTIVNNAPEVSITSPAPGASYRTPPTLEYTVHDHGILGSISSSHPLGHVFADEGRYSEWVEAVDTEGLVGRSSVEFVVDMTPPATTPEISGLLGENDWFTSPVSVTLEASDALSAVTRTEYSLDGAAWRDYSGPVPVDADGVHTLLYRSTDAAGNTESDSTLTVRVDTASPSVDAIIDGPVTTVGSGWFTGQASAEVSGADAGSGLGRFEYKLDEADWAPVLGPVVMGEGVHTLLVRSFDVAGNPSTILERTARVDTAAPQTWYTLNGTRGDGEWFTGPVSVELDATDGGSGAVATAYSLDGGATWLDYTGTFTVDSAGVTGLTFKSVDAAGNEEPAQSCTVRVDVFDPTVLVTGVSEGDRAYEPVPVFEGADPTPGSGLRDVTATLDGVAFASGTPVTAEGPHTLAVTATDASGRSHTETIGFTVDRTAPDIIIANPLDGVAYRTDQALAFAVSDLDPFTSVASSHPNDTVFAAEGAHSVSVSASDSVGNMSSRSAAFTIDRTPPQISTALSGSAGANGWWISEVTAHLNATDPMSGGTASGVATVHWRLNGGAWSDGAVATVSTEGSNTLEYYAVDRAGNSGPVVSETVKVDLTDPILTVSEPTTGVYLYHQELAIRCSAADAVSGVTTHAMTLNGASVADTTTTLLLPGANTYVSTATDAAGRTAQTTVPFTVVFQPGTIFVPGEGESINSGKAVTVRFSVLTAHNTQTDGAVAMVDASIDGIAISHGYAYLKYNGVVPEYQYAISTTRGQTGQMLITITLNDGATVMTRRVNMR